MCNHVQLFRSNYNAYVTPCISLFQYCKITYGLRSNSFICMTNLKSMWLRISFNNMYIIYGIYHLSVFLLKLKFQRKTDKNLGWWRLWLRKEDYCRLNLKTGFKKNSIDFFSFRGRLLIAAFDVPWLNLCVYP